MIINRFLKEKNIEMFERWDKIRPLMGSDFIHIAIVHADDQEELGIERDDLYLIKAFDKDIENYFDWIATDKIGDTESVNGGCTNYKDLIQLETNIEWINTELLENLEVLYDIK